MIRLISALICVFTDLLPKPYALLMFDLDPLSRPIAVVEMLLLLALAAFIGWMVARILLQNRITTLRSSIAAQELTLNDCRQAKQPVDPKTGAVSSFIDPVRPSAVVQSPAVLPTLDEPEPAVIRSDAGMDDAPLALAPERPFLDSLPPIPEPVMSTPAITTISGGSEAAVLQRIAARSGELNFDRIGLASAAEADDLKDIVGIGPFLERKLHSLGIYTFRQVANFAGEDVNKVNDIIEFFPGRIERDNWVDQAKVCYARKYGQSVRE